MTGRWLPPEARRRRLLWLLTLSAVVLLGLTVRASFASTDHYGQEMERADRAAVMHRATALATLVMSYNAATAESDVATAKTHMTNEMQRDYDRTLPPVGGRNAQAAAGVRVKALVARLDGGNVRASCPTDACAVGISSLTPDKATVLLFVNQYATARSTKNIVVNPTWTVMRLIRRDGEWIVTGMKAP